MNETPEKSTPESRTYEREGESSELHPILVAFKKRPYIYSFVVGALALTLMRPCLVVEADKPTLGPKVESFTFTDQSGAPFSPSDLAGSIWLAGFFDPYEPTSKSSTFKALREIEKRYVDENIDTRLVLLSVSLKEGTGQELARIQREEGLDPKRWILLQAPDEESLRQVAVNIFRARYDPGAGQKAEHSDRLWLIDRNGYMRGHPRQGRDNYKTTVRNHDDIFEWSRVVMKERTKP
tara:strand:+ start:175 stop:885 length:711 start_codon:yes stop_codon:yes gene_type:complete